MNQVFVNGLGAVSPAGWGVPALREALIKGVPMPGQLLPRDGWSKPLPFMGVPPPATRPGFLNLPRLRRTSPISQYAAAAAFEAIGDAVEKFRAGRRQLGVILCVMSGCVNYSRRFYDETLKEPATASPLVFPETVFNAPASHIAALLGTTAISYTLVGDPGTFLQGLALAADWLEAGQVEDCLVIGAEEFDWLTADAFHLFERRMILSAGAGALCLTREAGPATTAELVCITASRTYANTRRRGEAIRQVRAELPASDADGLLCDSRQNLARIDAAETEVWRDWPGQRISPKAVLGEGLAAATAWQCVAALDLMELQPYAAATVSVVGCNQQAIGAQFRNFKWQS